MTQAKPRFRTFEDYLDYDDGTDRRCELINGELIELPPESPENDLFALNLRDLFIRIVRRQLVRVHTCEMQVQVLEPKDPANRYPDLVILRTEHLDLMQRRLTIKLDMPPPQLVAEVISPGKSNRDRDLLRKREQYAAREIPEYWLIDPENQTITVLRLEDRKYIESGIFSLNDRVISGEFRNLELTVEEVFALQ
jgi:Uma2 family endonuclease